jgi:hypothetical protein
VLLFWWDNWKTNVIRTVGDEMDMIEPFKGIFRSVISQNGDKIYLSSG